MESHERTHSPNAVNERESTSPIAVTITSGCSTDSDRPHRCCHLPNNFDSRPIFHVVHNGPGDAPKIAPFTRGWIHGPTHVMHSSLGPSDSTSHRHLDWFSRFRTVHGCDQQTDSPRQGRIQEFALGGVPSPLLFP